MRNRLEQVPALVAGLLLSALAGACSGSPSGPTPGPPPLQPGPTSATLLVAGDIGMCGSPGPQATATLVAGLEGTLVLPGDIAYMHGSTQDFSTCFHPTWGRFAGRWYASPGNHEYETNGAQPYYEYFGESAGDNGQGFYAFVAADWLVLMLNSNISMAPNSPQGQFVRQQLETRRPRCTIAVWHHPLFTSGPNLPNSQTKAMWAMLEEAGADVILNGHDHLYERFGRQNSDGRLTPEGMRQFTVGTGGATLYAFAGIAANSEARISKFGVLRLRLEQSSYRWEFLTAPGGTVEDSGMDSCR